MMWYCNRVLRQELRPYIEAQLERENNAAGASKTIVSLALRAYRKEKDMESSSNHNLADKAFLDVAIEQMKIFLFAGHDTTASTLCFALDQLYRNPEATKKVQEEHDAVFGLDVSTVDQRIIEQPVLLNKLPYTNAVIKETLRMYPPIGTVRAGSPTFFLNHPRMPGHRLPTDGFMIHNCNLGLQRNPDFWSSPDDFIPERWLGDEVAKLRKDTF